MRRDEPQLSGLLLLDPDVAGAGVVVADQDGGQRRLDAALTQGVRAAGDVGQHGLGDGRAGQIKSSVGTVGSRHANLRVGTQADGPHDALPDGARHPRCRQSHEATNPTRHPTTPVPTTPPRPPPRRAQPPAPSRQPAPAVRAV